jgi:hypothetical protein
MHPHTQGTVRHYSLSFAFVFADFVDRADIGMVQVGSRPSLAARIVPALASLARHPREGT